MISVFHPCTTKNEIQDEISKLRIDKVEGLFIKELLRFSVKYSKIVICKLL